MRRVIFGLRKVRRLHRVCHQALPARIISHTLIHMRKTITQTAILLLSVGLNPSVQAKPTWPPKPDANLLLEIDGKIFPKDSFPDSCKTLFKGVKCPAEGYGRYHSESSKQGDLIYSKTTFIGPDGLQVFEESWEKDGHVQKATIDNRVLGKKSDIEIKNGKVFYKVTDKDGSIKTSDASAEPELVVPSTVMSYVRPKFPELLAGKEVKLKVIVPDRRDSFTFYMKKIREEKSIDGDTIMVLEMKPSSIIVKAFVDQMLFYVRPKTGEMFAFEGKSSLRRKEGDKYKDIIANTAYEYKINTFSQTPATTARLKENCDPTEIFNKTGKPAKCEVKAE